MAARRAGKQYNINRMTQTTDVLRVRHAATIICARRHCQPAHSSAPQPPQGRRRCVLRRDDCHGPLLGAASLASTPDSSDDNRVATVFGDEDEVEFTSGWELLMQQRLVKNWLRSSVTDTVLMRYPGEYVFPGGGVDGDEGVEEAARREVSEELGVAVPADAKLRLISVKQTRPINNVSNIMYNFVAVAEENQWLADFDPTAANRRLEHHRAALLRDPHAAFWSLDEASRRAASPEVYQHQWLDVAHVVRYAFTSMNRDLTPVNEFQAEEFARYGRSSRDPLFLTMLIALEMESFPSLASIVRHCSAFSIGAELERVQWLRDGMAPDEVADVFAVHRARGADRRELLAARRAREEEDAGHAGDPSRL